MDKMKLAHEYALVRLTCSNPKTLDEIISLSWYYADAMQAEAEKREQQEQNKLKQDQQNHHDELVSIGLEEWQPDWSQAPDNAKYWAMDGCGQCNWYAIKPEVCGNHWDFGRVIEQAHTGYCYKGSWQDSLRERPHGF